MSDVSCNTRKLERRLALLEAGGEPNGTGTPCAECEVPRTIFNTSVIWSDRAKTRLTFHYAVCDACRSAKMCKRLRDDPAAKLVQMGADAAARTKRPHYEGAPLSARECTDRIATLLVEQEGRCASCKHEVRLAADAGIYMASLDKVGGCYDDGTAQVLCFGCQRLFNDLCACDRAELTRAIVRANAAPRPRPVEALPLDFERSVATKVQQMHRREVSTDRPSRGSAVDISVATACRRLRRSGLHCVWDLRHIECCAKRAVNSFCISLITCIILSTRCVHRRSRTCLSALIQETCTCGRLIAWLQGPTTRPVRFSRSFIGTTTPSTCGTTRWRAAGWMASCGRMAAGRMSSISRRPPGRWPNYPWLWTEAARDGEFPMSQARSHGRRGHGISTRNWPRA